MTRRIALLLGLLACLLVLPTRMSAQLIRFHLEKQDPESGKVSDVPGIRVYCFADRAHAEKGRKAMIENMGQDVLKQRMGYMSQGLTDNEGIIDLMASGFGEKSFLLLDLGEYASDAEFASGNWATILDVAKLGAKSEQEGTILLVTYKFKGKKDSKTMKEVESKAKRKGGKHATARAYLIGKDISFDAEIPVDSTYARNDARFVASPFLVCPAENNDTVGFFLPVALDGEEYDKTLVSRTGDNMDHDKLWPYVIKDGHMHLRKDTTVLIHEIIENYDRTRKYKGVAHVWYEDYNRVYHEGIEEVWDGRVIDNNRYLDWSSAQPEMNLDFEHYVKVGRPEARNSMKSYHMEFASGEDQLNTSDTLTMSQLNVLKEDLQNLNSSEDIILGDTLRGYASPEGGYQFNKALAQRRAQYLASIIRSTSGAKITKNLVSDSYVVTWREIADTLDVIGDSISRSISTNIRGLVSKYGNSNTDVITKAARATTWYPYVYDKIFPRMRRVEFVYKAATYAVLTPLEIYERYTDKNSNYYKGVELRDYEYYNLMNTLYEKKDFTGLERVSRQAMRNVKENVTRFDVIGTHVENGDTLYDIKETAPYKRSYALAAYYYVNSLLQRGKVDTTILARDYMDFDKMQEAHEHLDEHRNSMGWWNEPSIVLSQVMMLCSAGAYTSAYRVIDEHLGDNPKYNRLKIFLRAMQNEYDDPAVRDTVATSSPMNFLVAWIAYADKKNGAERKNAYRMALNLINNNMDPILAMYPNIEDQWDGDSLNNQDPRVQYMKAICRYKMECPEPNQRNDAQLFISQFIYTGGDDEACWASPMLDAIKLDKANAEYLKGDGNFNDAYRTLVLYFQERLDQGADMDQIKTEYDALRSKYISSIKQ